MNRTSLAEKGQGNCAVEVLLVDDNAADVRLAQEAFKHGGVAKNIHVARDGDEALSFLRKTDQHAAAPRPNLVLLDLNMPRLHGSEVLRQIKSDDELCDIPVVILTTSDAEEDIHQAYDLRANCYIQKPAEFTKLVDLFRAVEKCWLERLTFSPT